MLYDRKKYTLIHNGLPIEVEEPQNWNDDEKEFARHKDYHGISIQLSDSIEFVKTGKDYLQSIVETYGLNTDVQLLVEKKNPQTDLWEIDYIGWIDLLTMSIKENSFSVKFNSDPDIQLLKAKQNAKVELTRATNLKGEALSDLELVEIFNEGRSILLIGTLARYQDNWQSITHEDSIPKQKRAMYLQEQGEDLNAGPELVGSVTSAPLRDINETPTVAETFIAENDLGYEVNYDIQFTLDEALNMGGIYIPSTITYGVELHIYENGLDRDLKEVIPIYSWTGDSDSFIDRLDYSTTINYTFADGESAAAYYVMDSTGKAFFSVYNQDGEGWNNKETGQKEPYHRRTTITVTEDSARTPTTSPGIMVYEYAKRLNDIVLGTEFVSNLFARETIDGYDQDGYLSDFCFVHGMWLRGMSSDHEKFKPLSTSFYEFYKSMNAISPIGMAINNGVLRIEDRDYFYQKYTSIVVGEVEDLIISADAEAYASLINVGYKKAGGPNEDTQGLDEYNRETQYSTIIDKTENELDIISSYRADGYGMETIRRDHPNINAHVKLETDNKFDDEIWVLDVKLPPGVTKWELKRWQERFEHVSKVYSIDTVVNLWLSPINILLRHGAWLKPALLKELDSSISFNSSKGNAKLVTKLIDGEQYQQNVGIPVADLERSANKAMTATFRAPITYGQLNGTTFNKPNVYGLMEFSKFGIKYKGYIQSVKLSKGIGEFEVLLATTINATSSYVEVAPTPYVPTNINLLEI